MRLCIALIPHVISMAREGVKGWCEVAFLLLLQEQLVRASNRHPHCQMHSLQMWGCNRGHAVHAVCGCVSDHRCMVGSPWCVYQAPAQMWSSCRVCSRQLCQSVMWRGCRRPELEMMQRAIMALEEIYQREELQINEADMVTEVNAALEEGRQTGQQLDIERLKEQAFELLKVRAPVNQHCEA